jgi:putative (di)nucleoside polyphosphate hydrolase
MIDENGYRHNVGIIICNDNGKLFWGKNCGNNKGWQFPQGGVDENENPATAMFRELYEETGLTENDVTVVSWTKDWLYYHLPANFRRKESSCIGQKQKWFLLKLINSDKKINLRCESHKPEFSKYAWVDYWHPLDHIIFFKKDIYRTVLLELEKEYKKIISNEI